MERQSLRNRLFKKFEVADIKNMPIVKHERSKMHRSSEKVDETRKLRSNSTIKLPSLEKIKSIANNRDKNKPMLTQMSQDISIYQTVELPNSRIRSSIKNNSFVASRTQKRVNIPNNQIITKLLKSKQLNLQKLVVLLRASGADQFVYLKSIGTYQYEAVDFDKKEEHYLIVCSKGIIDGDKIITIEEWIKEEENYFKLRKIHFWSKYLKLKTFFHWKTEMKKHIHQINCQKLIRFSPLTHQSTRNQLLKIREQCVNIVRQYHIYDIQIQRIIDFDEYKQTQTNWIRKFIEKTGKKQRKIQSYLLSACYEIVRQYPVIVQSKNDLNNILFNIDSLNVRFDIKAALKNSMQKMSRLIKMVDMMFNEALANIVKHGLKDMSKMIDSKSKAFDMKTQALKELSFDLSKQAYIRKRDEILALHQFNNWITFELRLNLNNHMKLYPPLKQVHNLLSEHYKQIIKSLSLFKKPFIESTTFKFIKNNIAYNTIKDDQLQYTFVQYLYNDEQYNQIESEYLNTMDTLNANYHRRIHLFEPFLQIYQKYQDTKPVPELIYYDITESFNQISADLELLDRMNQGQHIVYGYVNHLELKKEIKQRILNYKQRISHHIPIQFHREVVELKSILENHIQNMEKLIIDVQRFVSVMKQVNVIEQNIGKYQTNLDQYKKISIEYEAEYKLGLSGCTQITNLMNVMKNKVVNFKSNKDSNMSRFKRDLATMLKDIQKETNTIEQKLSNKDYYLIIDPAESIYKQLCGIVHRLEMMNQRMIEINQYETVMTLNLNRVHKLQYLTTEFDRIRKVWEVMHNWQMKLQLLQKQQLMEIKIKQFMKQHQQYLLTLDHQIKHKEVFEVAINLKKLIEGFQPYIVLIQGLQEKYLRQKDWDQIQKLIKNRLNLQHNGFNNAFSPLLTVGYIRKHQIISLNPEISQILLRAKKEIEIQKMLEKFESWWSKLKLETQVYDNSHYLFIFTQNEQVRRQIEENMLMLLSILNNKYGGFARNQCNVHLRNLNNLIRLLEEIIIHQENFIELYPILSSNFCQKQLPQEFKKYQTILNVAMKQMKVLVNPVKGLNQATMSLLSSDNKQFESIHKSLISFLEKKRLMFQRFYFLDDKQMMELLAGLAKDSSIYRMFEGIKGWYIQNQVYTGVIGVGGQILRLKNWTFKNQELQQVFKALEQSIKYTLKTTIRQSLFSYEIQMKSLRDVCNTIPWMCAYAVEWILYCKQIQLNYLCNDNDMDLQIQLLNSNLNEFLQNPLKNSNMITLTLHMIHLTRELKLAQVNNVLDYNWQTVLRFYYEDQVIVRSLGGQYQWGGEYQGLYQVMVNTKDIRRAYCSILGGLNWGIGVVMQGPSGTGKTQTLKQLARSLAKFCLVFNCSTLVNTKLLQKLLSGLCYTASWICLDQINRLDVEVMSVIANQINLIKTAVVTKKEKFNFFGKQIVLRPGIGIFSTMNPGYANRTQLTQNLKQYFRFVSLNIPEYERIIQVMLYSKGFKDAVRLAKKISKTYQLLNLQFQEQKHYDFGLRAIKTLMQTIDKNLDSKKSEEAVLKISMRQCIKPRLTQNDVSTFTRTLDDMFTYYKFNQEEKSKLEEKYRALKESLNLGTIILGETSCKSLLINKYIEQCKPKVRRFNPNSLDPIYLLGGKISSGWQTGIVEQIVKQSVNDQENHYLMYLDSKIKAEWIQNFNTLLDDSKILSLANGSRIKLHHNFRMFFETCDIELASPATVTRCAIIYVQPHIIQMQDYVNHFFKEYYFPSDLIANLYNLLNKLNRQEIKSIFNIFESFLPPYLKVKQKGWMYSEMLGVEKIVIYLICLQGNSDKIHKFLTKQQIPPKNIHRYHLSFQKYPEGQYIPFDVSDIAQNITNYNNLYVPNMVGQLYKHLVHMTYQHSKSYVLFKGQNGSGKSSNIRYAIDSINESYSYLYLSLNKFTNSNYLTSYIEEKFTSERQNGKQIFVPVQGTRALIVVDNIALAKQQSLEFMRSFIQTNILIDLKLLENRMFKGHSMVCESNQTLDVRFQQHFYSIDMEMSKQTCVEIFNKVFNVAIQMTSVGSIVKNEIYNLALDRILKLLMNYSQIIKQNKFQYSCSLRQIKKLAFSVGFMTNKNVTTLQSAIVYFMNEINRIYHDRISDNSQLQKILNIFKKCFGDNFGNKFKQELQLTTRLNQNRPASNYPLLANIQDSLKSKEIQFYLPEFLKMHISRILRLNKMRFTNCLFIGEQGLGKRTIVQIAAAIEQIKISKATKQSSDQDIRKSLFKCIRECVATQKPTYYVITEENFSDLQFNIIQQLISQRQLYNVFSTEYNDFAYQNIQQAYTNYDKKNKEYERVVADYIINGLSQLKVIIMAANRNRRIVADYPYLMASLYINTISEWPEEALTVLGDKILTDLDNKLIQSNKQKLIKLSLAAYEKICQLSDFHFKQSTQQIHFSPMQYLRFMKTYLNVVTSTQDALKSEQEKLSKSIVKMNQTEGTLQYMKNKITTIQPLLKTKREALMQIIPGLQAKRQQAKQARLVVENDQRQVTEKRGQVQALKNQAQLRLKQVEPLLIQAAQAVSLIKRAHLSEIKSNNNPHKLVLFTLENISILLGDHGTSWDAIKKVLGDTELLSKLKNCQPRYEDYMKVKKRIEQRPDWTLENIEKVSTASKALSKWIINVIKYSQTNTMVEGKKSLLNSLKKSLMESEFQLKFTQQKFEIVNKRLVQVENQFKTITNTMVQLQQQIEFNKARLRRAAILQNGLASSIERWKNMLPKIENQFILSTCQAMFTAALLELSCPFSAELRNQFLTHLKQQADALSISFNPDYDFLNLYNPLQRQHWQRAGLATDPTSTHNGVLLMYQLANIPIIIDPDNQATVWLQKSFEQNYTVTKSTFVGAHKQVEKGIRNGHKIVLLIENDLDDLVESIVGAKIEIKGTRKMIDFMKTTFEVNDQFRLIICTKIRLVKLRRKLYVNHPIINFQVTRFALQQQLIIELLKFQNEHLYRDKTVIEIGRETNKKQLKELQDQIINSLINNKIPILDDENLITTLENSIQTANFLHNSEEELNNKTGILQRYLFNYKILCEKSAQIYISLNALSMINPLMNFSYQSYIKLFLTSCVESISQPSSLEQQFEDHNILYQSFQFSAGGGSAINSRPVSAVSRMSSRISSRASIKEQVEQIPVETIQKPVEQVKYNIYSKVDRKIFQEKKGDMNLERINRIINLILNRSKLCLTEQQRKILGLLLCIGKLKKAELNVLFNTKIKRESIRSYSNANQVTQELKKFDLNINSDSEIYSRILNSSNPFEVYEGLSNFTYLLIFKLLRPDRFTQILQLYIQRQGYGELLFPSDIKMIDIFQQVDNCHPLLFIMGDEPLPKLVEFLGKKKHLRNTLLISLGEGQISSVQRALEKQPKKQTILILHNLEISPSVFGLISRTLEQFQLYPPNPRFRLILILKPTMIFPTSISSKSFKVILENPTGIKNQMKKLLKNNYSLIANESDQCKTIAYSITLLHAVINDRKKFSQVGWNYPYSFTEMQYQNSLKILKQHINILTNVNATKCNVDDVDQSQYSVDMKALKYLIGQINYQGRISYEIDRQRMKATTNCFLTQQIFMPNFRFMDCHGFSVPQRFGLEDFLEHVEHIQYQDSAIFGLHPDQKPKANYPAHLLQKIETIFNEIDQNVQIEKSTEKYMEIEDINHPLECVQREITKYSHHKRGHPHLLKQITMFTKIFDLKAFQHPQNFFTSIRKSFALKNNIEFDAVYLNYTFIFKQDCYGITGLKLEGGKIVNNLLQDGHRSQVPIMYIIPSIGSRDKSVNIHQRVKIPFFNNHHRQGTINSFGKNTNLIEKIEIQSRKAQQFWVLRGTAFICRYD